MNLLEIRDLLQVVVDAGRMTPSAKEHLHKAFQIVDGRVKQDEAQYKLRQEGVKLSYSKTKGVIKDMESAINVFCKYPKEHNQANEDVKMLDGARQDLYHGSEFLKGLTLEEKAAKWDELSHISEERRQAKEFVEATTPIKALLSKYPNLSKDLKKCMEQVKEIKSKQDSRCYTPKQLTSMTEAFHKAAPVKENGKVVSKEA